MPFVWCVDCQAVHEESRIAAGLCRGWPVSADQPLTCFLWQILHVYPFWVRAWNVSAAETWLKAWEAQIPAFDCPCRNRWAEHLVELPPQINCPTAFFLWSWRVHNRVNDQLRAESGGHPSLPFNAVYDFYAALAAHKFDISCSLFLAVNSDDSDSSNSKFG